MAKKNIKITTHGKERVKDRGGFARKQEVYSLFKNALKCGKSPSDFKPPFSDFLKSKLRGGKQIKVYGGMIFFHQNKTLITAYKVPERYKDYINKELAPNDVKKTFDGVRNGELKDMFIHDLDMLYSMCMMNRAIQISMDDETIGELREKYVSIMDSWEEIFRRIGYTTDIDVVITDETCLQDLKQIIQDFSALTNTMVGFGTKKNERTEADKERDKKEFIRTMNTIYKIVQYLDSKNYYLVQKQ